MTTPAFAPGEARASPPRRMGGPDTRAFSPRTRSPKSVSWHCYLPKASGSPRSARSYGTTARASRCSHRAAGQLGLVVLLDAEFERVVATYRDNPKHRVGARSETACVIATR
jgi:hypothetical protein